MPECKFCSRVCKNTKGLNYHQNRCNNNPDRKLPKPKSDAWLLAMHKRKGNGTNHYKKARELGIPVPHGSQKGKKGFFSGRTHSEETKLKLSKLRIDFLRQNPDKVPYKLNHYSKGRSYAETYWKEVLDAHNMEYEEQYPVGIYQLDFAFLKSKIDLEIDGDQHYLDKKIIESDRRRTEYLESLGWTTIRIKWSDYKKLVDKKSFVMYIISQINNLNP